MEEKEAKKLVDETFTTGYNEDKFRLFIRNLFSNHEECTEKASTGKYIWEAFQDGIVSYKRLFKFIDPEGMEIDVLAVKLKSGRTLENARTMQRNFVARYLNGSRGGALKDAALVAFYADDSDEWRFSLVRMDYVLDEEKNKVKKELTPARRFSFLVGGNEKTHTARRQLFPILTGNTETTLTELEQAFNIESVTKEFFDQYKELFLRLTESLDKVRQENPNVEAHLAVCNIETADFCKKLLGQIVFLYFLQKKGWMGVDKHEKWGTGDKNYLRSLLEKCIKKGDDKFFDNYLEPLFYDALATERDRHYYSRFDCKIPFLNGGLFEPTNNYEWEQYDFNIPNELFSNNKKTKSGDSGDGILDIFDRYNFTVREDEALEKEVAVDPEMLGKVFENLLEVKDRKSKGAFYTPREIVHYMCQESLINYLDAKLNINEQEEYNVKVPKEDITDFIYHGDSFRENDAIARIKNKNPNYKGKAKAHLKESIEKHAKAIDKALADVKICDPAIGSGAFPVGIMHEIVRARLTLLETGLIKQTNKTNPYEYKRRAIQSSIYGVDIEESAIEIAKLRLWLSLVVDEVDMDEIKPLPNLTYKIVKGNSLLGIEKDFFSYQQLKQLEDLKELYFDETGKSKKQKYKRDIDKIIQSFAKDGQFDFEIFFSEVFSKNGGFDIVIANPPYISHDKLVGKALIKKHYDAFEPFADIYCYFIELAVNLQATNGCLSFITSNSYLRAEYGKPLRKLISQKQSIKSIINLDKSQVFDSAIVNAVILNSTKMNDTSTNSHIVVEGYDGLSSFLKFVSDHAFEYEQNDFSEQAWTLISKVHMNIKKKMDIRGTSLDCLGVKIRLGIATGANDAFIISEEQKQKLILADPRNAEIIKPVLRGRDISRYSYNTPSKNILLTRNEINVSKDYPSIHKYLGSFGEKFKARGAKGRHWTNLRACAFFDDFKQDKIIWIELTDKGKFALCREEIYLVNSAYFMLLPDNLNIEYLLGILNSKAIKFYLGCIADTSGMGTSRWINNHVRHFPISIDHKQNIESQIISIVKLLQEPKENISECETQELECKLNKLVYQLYDLTPEEIQIIEESVK